MELAQYFTKINEKAVCCHLCPNECTIKPGQSGICRYRKNRDGVLYAENYGHVAGFGIDPIEKSRCIISCPEAASCPLAPWAVISGVIFVKTGRSPTVKGIQ